MVVPPFEDSILAAVQACLCPWCGRGPWKMLAAHVAKMHGVSPDQLRDMAGLTRGASICDPAFAAVRSALAKSRGATPPRATPGRTKTFSKAGLALAQAAGRRLAADDRCGRAKPGQGAGPRKPRGACVVCGSEIAYRPGNARQKTCSRECFVAGRAAEMSEHRRQAFTSTLRQSLHDSGLEPDANRKPLTRRQPGEDALAFANRVATAYVSVAFAVDHPYVALAAEVGVAVVTVETWVATARRLCLLPPARTEKLRPPATTA